MKFRNVAMIVVALFTLLSMTATTALAQDPDNGQVLWEEQIWQCQQCHGPMGEGAWSGPLAGSEATAEAWIDQVRTPRRFMPAFAEDQVTDEQIIDMHAYMTSLEAPTGEFVPQQPDTYENEGQNLMAQKRCVACHAEEIQTGQGRLIDNYVEQEVVPTAEMVIAQLRTPASSMPAYSEEQVSDDEAAAIADYLAQAVSARMDGGEAMAEGEATAEEGGDETVMAEGEADSAAETDAETAPGDEATTEEAAPEALPQSGGALPNTALYLLLGGLALLLTGLALRGRKLLGR